MNRPPEFHPDPGPDPGHEPEPEPPVDSDALVYWVHTTLLPLYERPTGAITWCPQWWEHPEAIFRLELVRRVWETAVTAESPQALSDWVLHCADPHMAVLTSSSGPFATCHWSERRGFPQQHQPRGIPQHWPHDFDTTRFPALGGQTEQTAVSGTRSDRGTSGGRGGDSRRST